MNDGPSIAAAWCTIGDSHNNALAETINGLYKAELIHCRGPWRSFEAAEFATLAQVDWFNKHRLLEPVGNIPPAEVEARYYAMLEQAAMAACLKRNGLRGNSARFSFQRTLPQIRQRTGLASLLIS
ncbi:hypothetical protein J2S75_003667 [Ancylobacter polymorphus]|uniref:Integrase catalytic domain-containing protein n=1 Tax=Ancylobacter polymorphus TaxID=223390 RepID=A0ABU0BFK7_9HYPH|nr:hypothetical protein [Ancylobacter polymorphus]